MDTASEVENVSSKTDETLDKIEIDTNFNTPDSDKKENEDTGSFYDKDEQSIEFNVNTGSETNLQTACKNTAQTDISDLTGL